MPARAKTWVTCAPLALGVPSPKSQITCEPGGISALSSKGTGTPETVVRSLGWLRAAGVRAPHRRWGGAAHGVRAGGRRGRPLLGLLPARAAAPGRGSGGRVARALVAGRGHSATLLHDDVIAAGLPRRGLPAP